MSAVEYAIAVLRERFPMDADRMARLARSHRVRDIPQAAIHMYYASMANHIAGSFLDRLNDEELELRLEIDQRRMLDIDTEVAPQQDDEEESDYRARRAAWKREREENLEWTLKETCRRGGITPRTRKPDKPEVFALNPRGSGMRW